MYLWGLLLLLNVEVQRCFLSLLIVVYWLCTAAVSVLVGFRAPTAFKGFGLQNFEVCCYFKLDIISSVTQPEPFGIESSAIPTNIVVESSSMPQEDTPAPITPLNNTPPSQYQQSIILDDTDKDSYRTKAKKALAFADTHYENLHLKQKALILGEKDDPQAKRQKNNHSTPSKEN